MIRCLYRPPFSLDQPRVVSLPAGLSVAELVDRMDLPPRFSEGGTVCISGHAIPRSAWHVVRPKPVAHGTVTFHAPIQDGEGIFAALGGLALTLLSGGAAAGLFATSSGLFAAGSTSALFLAGGISLVGSLALNALVPPPTLGDSGGASRESRREASARGNLLEPNGTIMRVVGERRVYPPLLSEPLVTYDGDDEVVEAVYGLAGPHRLLNVRVGESEAASIEGLELETREGWPGDPTLSLLTRYGRTDQIGQELRGHRVDADDASVLDTSVDVALALPQPQTVATRRAPDEHQLQVSFPQGLGRPSAPDDLLRVPIRVRIRRRGTTTWRNLPEIHYQGADFRQLRATIKLLWASPSGIAPSAGSTKGFVALFQNTAPQTDAPASPGWEADPYFYSGTGDAWVDQNNLGSTGLRRYRMDRNAITFVLDPADWTPDVYEIELKRGCSFQNQHFNNSTYVYKGHVCDFFAYKGTTPTIPLARSDMADTLALQRSVSIRNAPPAPSDACALIALRARNQSIERLSVQAGGYVKDWDGTGWNDWVVTSNPAPHYRDVLVGTVGADPLPLENLDSEGLVEWRAACLSAGHTCDVAFLDSTEAEVLRVVAACGYARPYDADQWGVVRDYDRSAESPVQVFTPRNTANFQWAKGFKSLPDGFMVMFDDAALDYQSRQIYVFREGAKDSGLIEQVRYEGVTTEAQARARAAYDLAQLEKRATLYTVDVAWDALSCRRGDLVALVHDTIAENSAAMRALDGSAARVRVEGAVPISNEAEVYAVSDIYSSANVYALGQKTQALIRYPNGSIARVGLTNATGESDTLVFEAPVTPVPPGALVATSILEPDYRRVVVFSMTAKDDHTASLVLVDEANEVFAA